MTETYDPILRRLESIQETVELMRDRGATNAANIAALNERLDRDDYSFTEIRQDIRLLGQRVEQLTLWKSGLTGALVLASGILTWVGWPAFKRFFHSL